MAYCCTAHAAGQFLPGLGDLKPEIRVREFLLPKLKGEPLPCKPPVKECDLYGSKKPDQIWKELGGHASSKGEDVFFFTKLMKKNKNFIRTNGVGGTWTGKDSYDVKEGEKTIAKRRLFVYTPPKTEEEEPQQEKSELEHCGWKVFEYTIAKALFECSSCSTVVLCQLRKQEKNHRKTTTTGKRKRHDSVNQDSHTQPSDPSLEHDKVWGFDCNLTLDEWTARLDQLNINQDSHTDAGDPSVPDYNQLPHVVPRSPLNPTELPPTLEIDTEWTREGILRLLDQSQVQDSQSHNLDQVQVQDSQSHNLDQVQVQDSINDDVVPPSQLVSNSQHNWGTYLVPQSLSDIPDISDTGATSSELEESSKDYFRWDDYSRSSPSHIPDPMETEI